MRILIKKIYLLAPLIVLVALVSTNTYTMQFSASVAIFIAIGVGLINKDNRINLTKIVDALEAGGKGTITVAVACAMAGLVAGCITSTGLASKLITAIVRIPGQTDYCTVPDDDLLYRTGNGRSYDSQLLYYGGDLRAYPDCTGNRYQPGMRTLLRILLWNRSRYHSAGCAGSLCRFGHSQGPADEDGH